MILDKFRLTGKTAVVTGAARGNGASIGRALCEAGARVIACDIIAFDREQWEWNPADFGGEVVCIDLCDSKAIVAFGHELASHAKNVHILINNAGVTFGAPAESYSAEFWKKTMAINLEAPLLLCQSLFNLLKVDGASIINITSLGAYQGFSGNPAYVASKGGLKAMTYALAKDWRQYGIRVNNICPGYIRTNMTKKSQANAELYNSRLNRMILDRWGTSEDLAGAAVFLASDASAYITAQDIVVDGGWLNNGV